MQTTGEERINTQTTVDRDVIDEMPCVTEPISNILDNWNKDRKMFDRTISKQHNILLGFTVLNVMCHTTVRIYLFKEWQLIILPII